jgi:hypothetical protein
MLDTRRILKDTDMVLCGCEPLDKGDERQGIATTVRRLSGSEEPTLGPGQSTWQVLTFRGCTLVMPIVIVVAVIALACFGSYVNRQAHERELSKDAEWFMVARSEVLNLWLPQTLIELAKRQAQSGFIRTHEDLQQSLELQREQELWYAVTVRAYRGNGEFADTTYIRWPYYDPHNYHFQEFQDILASATGNPPCYPDFPTSGYSKASVHVIDEELLEREPREVMAELLGYRAPAADQHSAR